MKRTLLTVFLSVFIVFARWEQVNTGLTNTAVTSMTAWMDTLAVGTAGGGLFQSKDNGDNWINISGDLADLNINDVRGVATPTSKTVATKAGPFFTMDQVSYTDNTSTGLTNTDINYYWFGGDGNASWAIGTNGGGIFLSADESGPWTGASTGLSGDALIINDIGGYSDEDVDFAVAATDGGLFFADSSLNPWTSKSIGLTGYALKVKRLTGIGSFILLATHGGLYYNLALSDTCMVLIADEKFNTIFLSSTFRTYVFGENGYWSQDFFNYSAVDMSGISGGEVTCVLETSKYVFVGTESGGVFRRAIDEVTAVEAQPVHQPVTAVLMQNYPNPFNPSTTIAYNLPSKDFVTIKLFDIRGRLIEILINEIQPAGNHRLKYNAGNLAGGVYFYQFTVGNQFQQVRKMVKID